MWYKIYIIFERRNKMDLENNNPEMDEELDNVIILNMDLLLF